MSRVTKFTIVMVISVFIVGLSACDQLVQLLSDGDGRVMETGIPQLTGVSGEIPIGLVYPVTGRFATFAKPIQYGFELAIEEINRAQLGDARMKFIVEDDRSTPEGAVAAYEKLIERGDVPVIFGPTTSDQAEATFPIAQRAKVVAFSSSSNRAGLSALGDFLFRAGLTTEKLIPPGVRAAHAKLGFQRVAIIYDESDTYSIDSHEKFRNTLSELGVTILLTETFRGDEFEQSDEVDFSGSLNRIKAADVEAIFIAAQQPDLTAIQMQGRQLGITSEVRYITSLISDLPNAGDAAEGSITFAGWIATADTTGNQAFVKKYLERYDGEPNAWTAQSYAAVYMVAEAIAIMQSTDPSAIRDALADMRDFDTVLGKFSFDDVGDAVYDPIVLIVKDGQFEVFGDDDTVDSTAHIVDDLPIQKVSVAILESFPVQVNLMIEGYLADSCTTLHETTEQREGNTIHVQVTTVRPGDLACATVVTEIEHVVPLGTFDPGLYKAIVNGTLVEFEVQ